MKTIGKGYYRKESDEKVTGKAKYTNDFETREMLHARMNTSPYAHALIKSIDDSKAKKIPGVRAVIVGGNFPLTGEEIRDRPPIAVDRVRYHGEVVALVVAETPFIAMKGADAIHVQYEQLPVVNSPTEALKPNAPILHENLGQYEKIPSAYLEPCTNIANRTKVRKGNITIGWAESTIYQSKGRFLFDLQIMSQWKRDVHTLKFTEMAI